MATPGFCQTASDRFEGYEDMIGHTVRFYLPVNENSKDYYYNMTSPVVKVTGNIVYTSIYEYVSVDGVIISENNEVSLKVSTSKAKGEMSVRAGFDLYKNPRSVSDWRNKMAVSVMKYDYISSKSSLIGNLDATLPEFLKIIWEQDAIMPERLDGKVSYRFSVPDLKKTYTIAANDFDFFKKDFAESFVEKKSASTQSTKKYLSEDQYERMDSSRVYPAKIYYGCLSRELVDSLIVSYPFTYDEHYCSLCYLPFSPYMIDGENCYGIIGGYDVSMRLKDVHFDSVIDKQYLSQRKSEGSELRKAQSLNYSSCMLEKELASVEREYLEIDSLKRQTMQYYADNSIVFLSHTITIGAYNKYTADFYCNLYNPFDKRIKYVYITLDAYNCVEDVCDKHVVRYAGFIEKGDNIELYWEDLFKNQYLDEIVNVSVRSVTLIFDDWTEVTMTGDALKDSFLENHPEVQNIRDILWFEYV
jgi:hypothetical protein